MGDADFGIIGMAVMGQNLALNVVSKGFKCAVFNRTVETMAKFVAQHTDKPDLVGCKTLEEFVGALAKPRKVMLMVKAGSPVDDFIEKVRPLLEKGDIIIDGGNSHFPDTIRRTGHVGDEGLLYIGTGVSGGEEGALKGPAIMPGGHREAWDSVGPILTRISAHVDGEPCCAYIGPDGAGHYVKMVHNGIEYGDMQLICEAYALMSYSMGMSAAEMHEIFAEWNRGELDSYLIDITQDILSKTDAETGQPIVDLILDTAGQKGTGKWTSQSALDLGVPAATIAEAVFARCLSAIKDERVAAEKELSGPPQEFKGKKAKREKFIEAIRRALYASKICSYAQGFQLMKAAAAEYGWDLNFGEISMLWRGGCIIRARFLQKIKDAFDRNPKLANLLLDPYFKEIVESSQDEWREVVKTAVGLGVPTPAFSSALAYYDGYRRSRLPANLLQAQRDYFGAHTYRRVDREGTFHTDWLNV